MRYLVDSNILGRIASGDDPQHQFTIDIVTKLMDRGDTLHLTAQNLIEFRNVATRPRENNGLGLSDADANQELLRMEGLFELLEDGPAIYHEWKSLVFAVGVRGRQVHDARLAAVMRVHGVTHILTFNTSDFKRYPSIVPVNPTELS